MDFEPWLRAQGYSPSTVASTLRSVRRAVEVFHERGSLVPYACALHRMAAWAAEYAPAEPTSFTQAVTRAFAPTQTRVLAGGLRGLGKREVVPLDAAHWQALVLDLGRAGQSPAERDKARVVQVLLAFPYPARDLQLHLQEKFSDLVRHVPPSVAPFVHSFKRAGSSTLIEALDETRARAAYDAVRHCLLAAGRRVGVENLTFQAIEATPWQVRARTVFDTV